MNRTLLLKVKEQILAEPESFIMDTWVIEKGEERIFHDSGIVRESKKCGTMACIGGWTCLIASKNKAFKKYMDEMTNYYIRHEGYSEAAKLLLGIDDEEAAGLFSWSGWPPDLRDKWQRTRSVKLRAEIAAEVIDRLIATKCSSQKQA